MSKLQELAQARTAFIEQNDKDSWAAFMEELKAIFEKYPNVNSFETPCYANYFNDGDACHWYCHTDMSKMYTNDEEIDQDDEEENQPLCEISRNDRESGKYTPLNEYYELISLVPDDLLEKQCEDGQIEFYRDGSVKIGDYSHD